MPLALATRAASVAIAAIVVLSALTACSPSDRPTAVRAAVTASASPSPEQVALAAIQSAPHVGDPVTEEQAFALRYFSKTHSAYELRDGRWVILDRERAVPAVVKRDMEARAAKLLRKNHALRTSEASADGTSKTIQYLRGDDSAQRIVIPLVHGSSSDPDAFPATYRLYWFLNGPWGNGYRVASKAEGLRRAKAYIAKQKRPTDYVIVVAD